MNGKIKFFNQGKGFGFVTGEDGTDYFVHITGLAVNSRDLRDDTPVTFDVVEGDRGPKADNVKLAGGAPAADEEDDDDSAIEDVDED